MLKVILLFLLLVVIWAAVWLTLAITVFMPLLGEQITSVLGTLAGFAVGAWLMTVSMDVGYSRRWIKW